MPGLWHGRRGLAHLGTCESRRPGSHNGKMNPEASPLVSWSFVVLAAGVALAFITAVARTGPGRVAAAAGVALWMGGTWELAARGVLARFDARPPPLLILLVASIVLGFVLGFSRLGGRLALRLPLWALVGVQSFRLPLELAMHAAARERIMPTRMSFSGENFDIATGATAIVLAGLLARGRVLRGWVVAWNAGGAMLLGNIVVHAILASPTIHAFGRAPSEINTFVAYPPYVWLPAVLVVAALVGHILVARRLVARS